MIPTIRIQPADFDVAAEIEALAAGRPEIGAVVTFSASAATKAARLAALELEHYPGMAEAEIAPRRRRRRSALAAAGLTVIHRFGRIVPGERIVLVAAAAEHRSAAFAAAELLMDYLKTRAPFWKREHLGDGSTGPWVEAKGEDDKAVERWRSDEPFP